MLNSSLEVRCSGGCCGPGDPWGAQPGLLDSWTPGLGRLGSPLPVEAPN